jgi:DNA-binding MarR family transcriptional regulator
MTSTAETKLMQSGQDLLLDLDTLVGHMIRRSEKQLATAWLIITPGGLTIPQFSVLMELHRNPGLDQSTLAENIMIDTSTVADVCRRLRERGYIRLSKDPGDQRRNILNLTPDGLEVLTATVPHVQTVDDLLLSGLTTAERARFMALFRKAVSAW